LAGFAAFRRLAFEAAGFARAVLRRVWPFLAAARAPALRLVAVRFRPVLFALFFLAMALID